MWKHYIELFREDVLNNIVESKFDDEGLWLCCDYSVAIWFESTIEADKWMKINYYDYDKKDFRIVAIWS